MLHFSYHLLGSFSELKAGFESLSIKQTLLSPLSEIASALEVRKISMPDQSLIDSIVKNEKEGLIGYHGDSLDYMIYQDIIKFVIEIVVEIPIQSDFYFLAPPLDPSLGIQTKEDLANVFENHKNPGIALYDSTFPLNFSIWDNFNRLGLNSLEQFAKNESVKPRGYRRKLHWFFQTLGINLKEIDKLYTDAYVHLKSQKGVILQIFDESKEPYAFAKKIAYPSYPNGFISENRTIDEYFMDDSFMPPFPHEVRLILNNQETLNPKSPIKIVRYTIDIPSSTKKSYENALKKHIKKLLFNKDAAKNYRSNLKKIWGL